MSRFGNVAVVVAAAALALAGTASAESSGAEVFNYGQCVSQGFPHPSSGDFGPLILVLTPSGTVTVVPPGLENPSGQIGCPVVTGP